MRPLRLSLQAIGPFKGLVEIDFNKIGANALFLIHGKTGSGKTTLFDAICYALYGKVPSGREGSLKSDFALETDKPFVEFTFALQDVRYVAYRQWAYKVPLKTKDGTKGCPESCSFTQISADGKEETLATSKKEMTALVQDRLGLDVNQFSQVVLLPQGEFRQLLLASSQNREILMEKLFDASLYDGVQDWFDAEVKRFEGEGRDATASRQTLLGQVRDMIPEDRRPADDAEIGLETIEVEAGGLQTVIEGVQSDVKALSEAAEVKRKALENAQQLATDLEALEQRRGDSEKLAEQQTEIASLKSNLALARIAVALVPEQNETERKEAAVKASREELSKIEQEYAAATERKKAAQKHAETLPALEASVTTLATVDEQAKELRHAVGALNGLLSRQVEAGETLTAARKQQQACEKKLTDLKSQLGKQVTARDELKASETDLASLCSRLEKLQKGMTTRQKIEKLAADMSALKVSRANVDTRRAAATETLTALKERWSRNAAGLLAQELQDGTGCPVCGSPEHPRPAKLVDATATQDAIDAAERALAALDSDFNKAAIEVEKTSVALESENRVLREIEEQVGEKVSREAVTRTKRQKDAETKRQSDLKALEESIRELETKQIPKASEMLAGYKSNMEAATTDLGQLAAQIAEQKKEISRQHQSPLADRFGAGDVSTDSIDKLINAVSKESAALRKQMDSIRDELGVSDKVLSGCERARREINKSLALAASELGQLKENISAKLEASPFDDVDALKKAVRTQAWMDDSEKRVTQHEERIASVRAVIDELMKRVGKRGKPDLEGLARVHAEQQSKAEEAIVRLHGLQHTAQTLARLADDIRALDQQFEQVEKQLKVLGRIEKQACGNGQPKISLKRFFLAQRLEEVLIQASNRLQFLSDGRFDLRRDPNVADGRAGAGLDLLVFDGFTGTERPVNSLSGGQMFLASLSMALGLADVVQARSGGIRLDTLFVDEGFGSLDDETLQVALKVLNELRKGRMVGVISHVEELKRQIEKKIEVQATGAGSTLKMFI